MSTSTKKAARHLRAVPQAQEVRSALQRHAKIIQDWCAAFRPTLGDMVDCGRHDQIVHMEAELVRVLKSIRAVELEAEEMGRS